MRRQHTSIRLRKEYAAQTSFMVGAVEEKEVVKVSWFKRNMANLAIMATITLGSVTIAQTFVSDYEGSTDATICWDCGGDTYNSPKDAIKAINPDANQKKIARAENEFIAMNNLPHKHYSMYLQAGEYKIPVIK